MSDIRSSLRPAFSRSNSIRFFAAMMFAFWLSVPLPSVIRAEDEKVAPTAGAEVADETDKAVFSLSKDKWDWMSQRDVEALEALFHEEAVFVHMGGTMSREQELGVIKSGSIQYKKADIEEASVRVIGTTAIVLNKIRLTAVVGGNEVVNPFVVTEVYVQKNGKWLLASLSFTRLLGP